MKKLIIILMLFAISGSAQTKYGFEVFERHSNSISKLQKSADNQFFGSPGIQVSFPDQSFTAFSYNRKAQHIVYRKIGNTETADLTEDIDFSKATGLDIQILSDSLKSVRVYFPAGSLKTKMYSGAIKTNEIQPEYLDFYVRHFYDPERKFFSFELMFSAVYTLICNLKIENGMGTEMSFNELRKTFRDLSSTDFLVKYPNSILSRQAKKNVEDAAKVNAYMEKVCKDYGWYPDISLNMFQIYIRDAYNYHCNSCRNDYDYNLFENKNAYKKNKDDGLYQFRDINGSITYYSYVHHYKNGTLAETYKEFLKNIKSEVPLDYIEHKPSNGGYTISLTNPERTYSIKHIFYQYQDYFVDFVTFEKL